MKKFHLFLALITLVAFTSCDRIEDGAYSPKEKISKVYYEDWDGEKKLNAIWNWDGKQLQSIEYYWNDEIDYTEHYTYNKDGRIESVIDNDYGETIKYEYDGKKLSKAQYYEDGYMEYEYDFVYDGKKISEIGLNVNVDYLDKMDSKNMRFDPLALILPQFDMAKVKKIAKKTNLSKDVTVRVPIKLEWDGDNVSKMSMVLTVEGFTVGVEMEYKYDNKINPFKNILLLYPEESINFECSKNNATEITIKEIYGPETDSYTIFVAYTYDGKYPVSMDMDGEVSYYEYQ